MRLSTDNKKTNTIDNTTDVINPAVKADNIKEIIASNNDKDRPRNSEYIFWLLICL